MLSGNLWSRFGGLGDQHHNFLDSFFQCHRLDGGLSKLLVASNQLAELNEKLAIQKVAVTEKSEACEKLLAEISQNTEKAMEKKQMAEAKKEEINQQNKIIVVEKVTGDIIENIYVKI
jgi:dynein heavy chain